MSGHAASAGGRRRRRWCWLHPLSVISRATVAKENRGFLLSRPADMRLKTVMLTLSWRWRMRGAPRDDASWACELTWMPWLTTPSFTCEALECVEKEEVGAGGIGLVR